MKWPIVACHDVGQISTRIVLTVQRWPGDANTIAWDGLRSCVEALRNLVYIVLQRGSDPGSK